MRQELAFRNRHEGQLGKNKRAMLNQTQKNFTHTGLMAADQRLGQQIAM